MLTVFSNDHRLHLGLSETSQGKVNPWFEVPSRADNVLARVKSDGLGEIIEPIDHGTSAMLRVHDPRYLSFLQNGWSRWNGEGGEGLLIPTTFHARGFSATIPITHSPSGQAGYYSFDSEAPISKDTWRAVYSSAQVAITAQEHIRAGAKSAFALCRPPGHHAGRDFMGGYCYVNNAAVAAQAFIDQGASRVAILDVDYHHGNGTQNIFYRRNDVLFASIHASPMADYPYFSGFECEGGEGVGFGFNFNYPLAIGVDWQDWSAALNAACNDISAFSPDAVVISLGVDTFKGDPNAQFRLETSDYLRLGERLARFGAPVLFVMEGGYALDEIGENTVNVLKAYEGAS